MADLHQNTGPGPQILKPGEGPGEDAFVNGGQTDANTGGLQVDGSALDQKVRESHENDGLLLGKFKTQKDLEDAYLALEQKLGGKSEAPKDPDPEPKSKMDDAKIKAPEENTESSEFDLDGVAERFLEAGKLSETDAKALSDKGLSKEYVERYIAGQQALAEKAVDDLASVVGGRDNFKPVCEWAAKNLPAEETALYNQAVENGDITLAKALLRGINQAYVASNGSEPSLVRGAERQGPSGAVPFKSEGQLIQAMGDPRYNTDPDFRAQVDNRLAVTDMTKLSR